jgi:uncharacterized protein
MQNPDWAKIAESLNTKGYACLREVLTHKECGELRASYDENFLYRSTVDMQRYRFGRGEYKYFKYPLPAIIQKLRQFFYFHLSQIANQWMEFLNIDINYPVDHELFINNCQEAGQLRPTPLILRYEKGGYNTLHQDLYGEVYFPFQVVLLLSQMGEDFEGGEFVLVEQIPRAQSRAEVVKVNAGDAVIFTTNFRPVKGTKGYYRATMKHGVSEIKWGTRYAAGIIFHDAL